MPSSQKKYTTLVSNTMLFAISNFSSKLLSFFIRPYLSYALDSPDVMGVSSLLQQATNLLIPVVSLGVAYAVIRFGLDKENDKSSVFVNGAATICVGFLVLAVLTTLYAAVLPLQLPAPDSLLRRAGRLLAAAPARCVLAGVLMLAGIGGIILLFPVSIFWAVLFGFWLPGLAAMQTLFPILRQEYGVPVRTIPRPAAPDKPLTVQEQKKRSRANWWYYNWGIVAVAALVIVGVVYVAHGLLTTVDPDYTVAVVTADALPDEAVQRLQTALADYAEDANGDGAVVVQVNNYTWSANASLTDMNGQMAGATQMNTDLANGESKIWILEDPEGFEQAYGALSEKLGTDWQTKLIPWSDLPALSALELGSYATAADGSQTVDVQSRFAGSAWRCSMLQMRCGRH